MSTFLRTAVFATLLAGGARAQADIDWFRTYDGASGLSDGARRCDVDAAGNVYAAGTVENPMSTTSDFALLKYASSGVLSWSVEHDAFASDWTMDCRVAAGGDIYVAGSGANVGQNSDLVLLKFTSTGALAWVRVIATQGMDFASQIDFDAAGNVVVCGTVASAATGNDALIASYAPAGTLNWSTAIDGGGGLTDAAHALRVLASGDIVVVGEVNAGTAANNFGIWKLSANGAVIWSRSVDGGPTRVDEAYALAVSPAGKLLAGGTSYRLNSPGVANWMITQLDIASGNVDWTVFHDPAGLGYDQLSQVAVDAGGTWWATGMAHIPGTIAIDTLRYDAFGTRLSSTSWLSSAPGNSWNVSRGIEIGSAGQAWVAGYSLDPLHYEARLALLQYDAQGNLNWAWEYPSAPGQGTAAQAMSLAPNDRVVLVGETNPSLGANFDMLVLQLDLSDSPQAYCTAKTTSNGCVPSTTFTGMSSASASSGFVVSCAQVRNQKNGLLFYGVNSAALPFQGGTMCVATPQVRTPIQTSGGNLLPADDCSGSFALDMNAYATGSLGGAPLPALQVVGSTIHCQFWGRDPGFTPPQNTMLSNALRYVVLP